MKFVDIVTKKEKGYNVISKIRVGQYSGPNMLRKEFGEIATFARKNKIKTGKWFFIELDGRDAESKKRRWKASIEVIGKSFRDLANGMEAKKLPSQLVARVTFDPDLVSPRLVYHGLESWLDWRKKDREMEQVGPFREVYQGNPWTDPKAWASLEVQVPVRKL